MESNMFVLFMTYIPVAANIVLAFMFFLVQIPYIRLARKYSSGARGLSRGITDAFSSTLFGPVLISVISFVFYELYIFFDGTLYLVSLLMVFYFIPVFSVVYFICYFVRLMRIAGGRYAAVDAVLVMIIIAVIVFVLFWLLFGWLYLPLSMISFAVPFFSLPLLAAVGKKR